jgi:hypothetical protein
LCALDFIIFFVPCSLISRPVCNQSAPTLYKRKIHIYKYIKQSPQTVLIVSQTDFSSTKLQKNKTLETMNTRASNKKIAVIIEKKTANNEFLSITWIFMNFNGHVYESKIK